MTKEENKPLVDLNNLDQMAEDIWLFLTNANLPPKATIKKESFIHEVKVMMDMVRQHHAKQQSIVFGTWMLKTSGVDIPATENDYSVFLQLQQNEHQKQNNQ
jgi:hypothetical protein